jgi:hypothetical protein
VIRAEDERHGVDQEDSVWVGGGPAGFGHGRYRGRAR